MIINFEIFDDAWRKVGSEASDPGYLELPPWPEAMRVSGTLRQWQKVAFKGEELIGVLWRSESGTIRIDDYPYDQAVVVMRGSLRLRDDSGKEQQFGPGGTFLLPRGFKGLWIMEPGDYEELVVVERSTFLRHE